MVGSSGDDLRMELKDSKIFGEAIELEEPTCKTTSGIMIGMAISGGKPVHITMPSSLPMYKAKSNASFGGNSYITNTEFIGFESDTNRCGAQQKAITLNPSGSDNIVTARFEDVKFTDVSTGGFGYFYDPMPGWAGISDCGEWPCTAPENIVLKFKQTTYSGSTPTYTKKNFQIIADFKDVAGKINTCEKVNDWNAYICENEFISQLVFESLDEDKNDRSVQPVYLTNSESGARNKLNSYMDHVWDGFYTG